MIWGPTEHRFKTSLTFFKKSTNFPVSSGILTLISLASKSGESSHCILPFPISSRLLGSNALAPSVSITFCLFILSWNMNSIIVLFNWVYDTNAPLLLTNIVYEKNNCTAHLAEFMCMLNLWKHYAKYLQTSKSMYTVTVVTCSYLGWEEIDKNFAHLQIQYGRQYGRISFHIAYFFVSLLRSPKKLIKIWLICIYNMAAQIAE